MMHFDNEEHGHIIMAGVDGIFTPGLDIVISRTLDGKFLGGVVFSNHTGESCEISQYGETRRWIDRDMLYCAFDYPFNQLGYSNIIGRIRASHQKTIDLNVKYGFKEVAKIRSIFPGDDLVIMQMFKHECRWLNIKPRTVARRECVS